VSCGSPLRAYQDTPGAPVSFLQDGQRPPPGRDLLMLDCGWCKPCRVARSRAMGARILHEAQFCDSSMFLTLTYSPKFMPWDGGLNLKHVQNFIAATRKAEGRNIKYSLCGEYGPSTGRPHYHLCVFDYWPSDAYVSEYGDGIAQWCADSLEARWGKGFVQFRDLDKAAAEYTARHNFDKVYGSWKNKPDEVTGLLPYERIHSQTGEIVPVRSEFFSQSNGIGERWIRKYYRDVFPKGELSVMDADRNVVFVPVPKYYQRKLQDIDPAMYAEFMEARLQKAKDLAADGYYSDYFINARRKIFDAKAKLFGSHKKVMLP